MNFLTSILGGPYKWAIVGGSILAVVVGIYIKGHHDGATSVQAKWDVANAKQAIELAKHNANVTDIMVQSAKISDEASTAYDKKLEEIRKYYEAHPRVVVKSANGVCNTANGGSGKVPSVSNSTVAADEEAANDGYVAPGIKIETLPERCAETTQQLLELQGWVVNQKRNFDNAR